ncbi:hypothetical protein E0H73_45595 [Kribbella pittospori]|uniref:Endonuclease/exonuclease/phosphatase domain-containing protein n=1 Tax=Kribbella pittospori TaxID=722689 RepID=A0A4R0JCF8_9ACTN|nr:endonuclease/exonuclease/phosphatase family protein [Kribbella pittospori]TCC44371.1 hypothetical protein E0H73_45595 [Kribbella pittospori]
MSGDTVALDHQRERLARAEALATLVSELSGSGDRVVLAGALNSPPGHPELKPLLDALEDCWLPGENGLGVTYSSHNRYLGRGEWLEDNRIDYILTRGGLVPRE